MTREELLKRFAAGERDFSGQDLSNISLRDARLPEIVLRKAVLANAKANGAVLDRSRLDDAQLPAARLNGAKLHKAHLNDALLDSAVLVGADLGAAECQRADFERANLARAILRDARLAGAKLTGANLRGADLSGANLAGAVLTDANLDGAKFDSKAAKTLEFDGNSIRGTRLPPFARDSWSILRRAYSGPRLALHLLTIVLFAGPYVSQALFWVAVNRTQSVLASASEELAEAGRRLAAPGQPDAAAALGDRLRGAGVSPCLERDCKRWRLWQLLVGYHRGPWVALLAVLLILYNGLRFFLTLRVSAIRDEEERSQHAPRLGEYRTLWGLHWVVQGLAVVAWGSLVFQWYRWSRVDVWLPGV